MAMYYTPIPHEYLEEMGELSDAEYGRLIRWCQTYSITGEEIELSGNERFYRIRCKKQIDKVKSEYEALCEKNRANGAKGGRPKTQNNPTKPTETQNNPTVILENPTEPNTNPTEPKKPNKNINKNKNENENIKEKDNDSKESLSKKKAVITAWNDAVSGSIIPQLRFLKDDSTRYQMLNARINEYGMEQVMEAIVNVQNSDFLRSSTWFSFDWFVKPNNFPKVLEGNYTNKDTQNSQPKQSSWLDIATELEMGK